MRKYQDWALEEIDVLKENYPYCTGDEMEKLLPNRKKNSINAKASNLGIKKLKQGDNNDIKVLKNVLKTNYLLMK